MKQFIMFLIIFSAITAHYFGHKVFEVIPKTSKHLRILDSLHASPDFDFWSRARLINHPVLIMVKEGSGIVNFNRIMTNNNIQFRAVIDNVERFLRNSTFTSLSKNEKNFHLDRYNSYITITQYLYYLQRDNPTKVYLYKIGQTICGRDILGLRISNNGLNNNPAIFVDAGIHAREWIAPAVALYIIDHLVHNPNCRSMVARVDWFFVPLANPDGYEYSRKKDRLWRKNRRRGAYCDGVDINRNFGFHWMEGGSTSDECGETYAGLSPFSERESQAIRSFILSVKKQVKVYVTLHSYGNYIIFPWNYTPDPSPDYQFLNNLARRVSQAIWRVSGSEYSYGISNRMLYLASGNSEDWMKGVAGINYSYAIELPGGGTTGFDIEEEQIIPTGIEILTGFKIFADFVSFHYCS